MVLENNEGASARLKLANRNNIGRPERLFLPDAADQPFIGSDQRHPFPKRQGDKEHVARRVIKTIAEFQCLLCQISQEHAADAWLPYWRHRCQQSALPFIPQLTQQYF